MSSQRGVPEPEDQSKSLNNQCQERHSQDDSRLQGPLCSCPLPVQMRSTPMPAYASVSWVSTWPETRISTPSSHAKSCLIELSTRSALLTSTFTLLCLGGSFLLEEVSAEMSKQLYHGVLPASLVQPCLETLLVSLCRSPLSPFPAGLTPPFSPGATEQAPRQRYSLFDGLQCGNHCVDLRFQLLVGCAVSHSSPASTSIVSSKSPTADGSCG